MPMNPNLNALPEDEDSKAASPSASSPLPSGATFVSAVSPMAVDIQSVCRQQQNGEAALLEPQPSLTKPIESQKDTSWLQLLSPERASYSAVDIPSVSKPQQNGEGAPSEFPTSSSKPTEMPKDASWLQLLSPNSTSSHSRQTQSPQHQQVGISCPNIELAAFPQDGDKSPASSLHQEAGVQQSSSPQAVVPVNLVVCEPMKIMQPDLKYPTLATCEAMNIPACEPVSLPQCEPKYSTAVSRESINPTVHESVNLPQCELKYPAPLATHEAVLSNKQLFLETLCRLHAALGLKVHAPKIGDNDVDLHKLYKEVTCRGGLEQVINDRKWREVALSFHFPPTVTSASCVLRRSYLSCLHHYEQVYFFGVRGKILSPPAAYAVQSSRFSQAGDACSNQASTETGPISSKGTLNSAEALGVDPASSIGMTVCGAIDGKFDNGYLVSVMVGARKMRGVLYHVASTNSMPQHACLPALMKSVGSELRSSDLVQTGSRKRRKTEFLRKDPNAPRQNRTGYNFFFAEQRAKLKTTQPDKDRAISKMIGELWNKLSEDEKSPYQAQGIKDKERYRREMREYKEKFQLTPVLEQVTKDDSKAAPLLLGYQEHDLLSLPPCDDERGAKHFSASATVEHSNAHVPPFDFHNPSKPSPASSQELIVSSAAPPLLSSQDCNSLKPPSSIEQGVKGSASGPLLLNFNDPDLSKNPLQGVKVPIVAPLLLGCNDHDPLKVEQGIKDYIASSPVRDYQGHVPSLNGSPIDEKHSQ